MPSKTRSKVNTILFEEKKLLLSYMRYRSELLGPELCRRRKNAVDSTNARKQGNRLYGKKAHDAKLHEDVWKLYAQSILLAPNNSEELALGYGNRSALLLHLKKFEECIKDCDRAIGITHSNPLKCKLLCRKAECLMLLKKSTVKVVASRTLKFLEGLVLENSVKCIFIDKLNIILKAAGNMKIENKNHEKKNYFERFQNFPRLEEAPCASKSVELKYDEQWGRHLVATQKISPGEVIAVDEVYCTFLYDRGIYLFCANCSQYAWSSVPCEHCIYNVYCSESCRSEAWQKYHQFECPIYPYLGELEHFNVFQASMKLMLIAISEVGGIPRMKEIIADIENCKDPRLKGFTDGAFHSGKAKSFYSLSSKLKKTDTVHNQMFVKSVCTNTFLLATCTTFFGSKLKISPAKMFSNEDLLFVAALLLHTLYVIPENSIQLSYRLLNREFVYAYSYLTFASLFNHSCDPNTEFFVAKNNKVIVYARGPIEKGSQLFICYTGDNFLSRPKEDRHNHLIDMYGFSCNCLPCVEDWSSICVPALAEIVDFTPILRFTVPILLMQLELIFQIRIDKRVVYSTSLMKDVVYCLETLATKITVHCEDYTYCLIVLKKLLLDVFGSWYFELPDQCYTP